jgi:hypothetical protein
MRRTLPILALLAAGCGAASPPGFPDGSAPADLVAAVGDASGGADTWSNFAQSFFATYCVRCHGVGNANRDYTQYSQVVRDAALIACGVNPGPAPLATCTSSSPTPKQFPIGTGPLPSDAERERLVLWIQAGLAP